MHRVERRRVLLEHKPQQTNGPGAVGQSTAHTMASKSKSQTVVESLDLGMTSQDLTYL
eukprot:COSAG02_NODE_56607_length_284_cov_1.713514_1_plen_57_part_01